LRPRSPINPKSNLVVIENKSPSIFLHKLTILGLPRVGWNLHPDSDIKSRDSIQKDSIQKAIDDDVTEEDAWALRQSGGELAM
jgi:hypothetical protein